VRYVNTTTGEIIELQPYRLNRLGKLMRRYSSPKRTVQMKRSRTYHARLSWSYWCRQLLDSLGPVVIGMTVLWVLLGAVGGPR